ncbi:MAG: hypothetical protein LC687_04970 [Actinobacteria bacterium]|nr:hypothetical protein [Actinomycetota bacterium]MCA1807186.1 hypothetical protein [Actinomycetota bacterium]
MALPSYALPFGLRDVKIQPLLADGTPDGAKIDLPASRVFSFKETEDYEELEGDDTTVASHGKGPVVEWELEGGGISLAVWKALSGGTTTAGGITPNATNTYSKKNTDARPYFDVEGQAISDSGGDFHTEVYRCKADGDLEANMENGSFMLTSASGKGYGNLTTGDLYDFVHNESVTPITV